MAEALVGGAFLSSFLNVVFDKLASPQVANFIRGKKLDPKLLQRMRTTLTVVRAVLNDAEKKQFANLDVNNWLNDLKDAVYVADDLLDEVSTKAATQKAVSNPFSRFFNIQDSEMASKLEDIVERLEFILKLKESLDLKEIATDYLFYRTPSTSLPGAHVYGRDEDKKAIIKLLLDDNIDGEEVSVVSIVGMGGLGKTTLAQMVYNDDKELKFDLRAWACVSEEFDIMRVTKIITEEVTKKRCDLDNLNLLQINLQDTLKDKKFFIVLDDVWVEDSNQWDLLMRPFQHGVRESKILVTARSNNVAPVLQTALPYNLKKLSPNDCWLVFANHACLSTGSSGNSTALEKVGRKIVEKCDGLPLAAQSLGGMLRRKHDIRDWDNLLKSDIWELSKLQTKIIPSLRVSYHYLHPNLKRCFVYCSLYPKDHEFVKNDLILLWMAEDLLTQPSKGKTLEEVGYEYLHDLVARSFLQRSSNPWEESFVMHDLLHDLATTLGEEFYVMSEKPVEETKMSIKTRHLSFTQSSGLLDNIEVFETIKFLRTFLPFGIFSNEQELHMLLLMSKLKHLRVLSFYRHLSFDALPDSIGELIHLRYLDFSRTSITTFPESLCNLHNLQTLKLYYCEKLSVLPNDMQNLVNLLYLDLSETNIMKLPESLCDLYNLQTLKLSHCKKLTRLPGRMQNLVNLRVFSIDGTPIKKMPKGMGKLTQLQNLSNFIVGVHGENEIKELAGLSNLHSLSIKKLENVSNGSEASEAKIMDKRYITDLFLNWHSTDNCMGSETEKVILCNLQPYQELQTLEISGYRGTIFPDWVGNYSYRNMTKLTLSSCNNCWKLPSLGQLPSLKDLRISDMAALEVIGADFYKNSNDSLVLTPFPLLESLEFENMPYWKVWSLIEPYAFPKLKKIKLSCCPNLKRILSLSYHTICENSQDTLSSFEMETFPNLKELTITNCENVGLLTGLLDCALQKRLKHLEYFCPNLASFPGEKLHAPILTRFHVFNCDKLKALPQQMNSLLPKLKDLSIANCPEIELFPEGGMPPSLESIRIANCEKLLDNLAWPSMDMLEVVHITGPCDTIKSFPKEGLLPSSIKSLRISRFSSLETLDCKGLLHLTSLQELTITICPKLENMEGERLPASLIKLHINNCPLLKELKKDFTSIKDVVLNDAETNLDYYELQEFMLAFMYETGRCTLHLQDVDSVDVPVNL